VGASCNVEELFLFFVFSNFVEDFGLEIAHANCWTIHDFQVVFFSGIDGQFFAWNDAQ
jgi:hypothetical protein